MKPWRCFVKSQRVSGGPGTDMDAIDADFRNNQAESQIVDRQSRFDARGIARPGGVDGRGESIGVPCEAITATRSAQNTIVEYRPGGGKKASAERRGKSEIANGGIGAWRLDCPGIGR